MMPSTARNSSAGAANHCDAVSRRARCAAPWVIRPRALARGVAAEPGAGWPGTSAAAGAAASTGCTRRIARPASIAVRSTAGNSASVTWRTVPSPVATSMTGTEPAARSSVRTAPSPIRHVGPAGSGSGAVGCRATSTTDAPLAARWISAASRLTPSASRPPDGSSSTSSPGEPSRACAIRARCTLPRDSARSGLSW
jgi:hypothetical protein